MTGQALRATGLYFFFCAANIGIAGTGYGVWIAGGDAIEREGIGEGLEGTIEEGIAEMRGKARVAEGIAREVAGESLEVAEIAGNTEDAEGYSEFVDAVETRVTGAEIRGTINKVREVAVEVTVEVADTDAGKYAETDSISEDSGIDTMIGEA